VAIGKTGLSLLELMVVIGIVTILGALLLPSLARSREAAHRANCQSNLKQLGLVLEMYSAEDPGNLFPQTQKWHLNGTPTLSWLRGSLLFPDYMTDVNMTLCPSDSRAREFIGNLDLNLGSYIKDAIDEGASSLCVDALLSLGVSYTYLSYLTTSSSQIKDIIHSRILIAIDESDRGNAEFVTAAEMKNQGCPRKQFVAYGWLGTKDIPGDPLYQAGFGRIDDRGTPMPNGYPRLRRGIERFTITDINSPASRVASESTVPVMLDTWAANVPLLGGALRFNHIPGGSNVLYLDGHVGFVKLGSHFPVANSPQGTYGSDLASVMATVSGTD
jgi:prepilin-type processing-associated H-X9-DG protein